VFEFSRHTSSDLKITGNKRQEDKDNHAEPCGGTKGSPVEMYEADYGTHGSSMHSGFF
jgi:hypothetical protein